MFFTPLRKALTRSRSSRAKCAGKASQNTLRSRRSRFEPLEDRCLLSVVPNDPLFSDQWALDNTGQTGGTWDADIDAPAAWSVSTGSATTVVAVLDTGIDYTHEDLYLNIWLNQGEIPATLASRLTDTDADGLITYRDLNDTANASYVSDLNATGYIDAGDLLADPAWADGSDTDGNGYTDDLIGWDWVNNDNDPMDENSHGTMVAGILGAMGDNGVGVAGVSWNVQMMPLRFKFNNPTWTVNAAVSAIDYAVDQGSPISSNSWGNSSGAFIPEIYDAIDRARQAGHLFVAAAGNSARDTDSAPRYPADYDLDNIISVAAIDRDDKLASFSNWGATSVDLAAPSPSVLTTYPGNQYGGGSGTSAATPHVAGVAALLYGLHPNWTTTQIKNRILSTVDPLPSLVGRTVAGGRLNVAAAVADTTIHMSDPSIVEGNSGSSALVFTATRRGDTTGSVTIAWSTAGGTATAGIDYSAASGQVVFGPGETQHSFPVLINGDTDEEANETVQVAVQLASGTATIADPTAQGVILNEDASIAIADATVTEGDQSIRFIDALVSAGSGGLSQPRHAVLGSDGDLYVSSTAEQNVLRYDGASGEFLGAFTAPHDGVLLGPQGLAFRNGSLFVAGWTSDNVVRYDGLTGTLIGEFVSSGSGGLDNAVDLVFGPDGNLYVASWNTDEVLRYDGTTGAPMGAFVTAVSGGLDQPAYIAFGPDGNLYVGSNAADCVLRYDGTTGAYLDKFVATGSGGLDGPRELVFRPDGYLYVASAYSDEVLRYDAGTGAFVDAVIPAANGGLNYPIAVVFDSAGNLLVSSRDTHEMLRYGPASQAAFTLSLSNPSAVPVTVDYATADGTAWAGSDYEATTGTLTFAPGETSKTILVPTIDDANVETPETFVVNLSNPTGGATLADAQGVATILDTDLLPAPQTKFFVVDSGVDDTFGYDDAGALLVSTNLAAGNVDPMGATASADGATVWVVDKNRTVYVYDGDGNQQGSWSAGGLNRPSGIATDETDLWVLDEKGKRVYRYNGAASLTSGSANPSSSFALDGANRKAKGITTDGASIWVVDDGKNSDRVFKYDLAGALLGSWAVDSGNVKPAGVALDGTDLWIVDRGAGSVFQYIAAAGLTSGSQAAASNFNLDSANSRAEGITSVMAGPPNAIPVAGDNTYAVDEDNTLVVVAPGVLAGDSDADGDPLTAVLDTGPANGSLALNADGSFTYTPDADFNGADSFTYRANDGKGNSNLATVTITVNPINDAPVALDDGYIGDQGTTLNVGAPGLLANDNDVDGDPLSSVPVAGPTNGLLTVNPDGSFDYTPNPGFFGTDTFTYKANDGSLDSNVATVTITVNRVNNVPVAVDDSYTTDEDVGLSVGAAGVLGNDADADGDPLLAVLLSAPTNGTLAMNADGSFTYTPDANFNGADSFTYKANDGIADSNVATVSITVNPVNDAPLAVDDSASTDQDLAVTIGVLANDSDADGDTLGVDSVTQGASGSVVVNPDGTVAYTPNAGFTGSDSFTYTVSDGNGGSATATVSVAVVGASSTKFFVVDSNVGNTFEYDGAGGALPNDTWNLASGNVDPKGATTNAAGTKVWVVDKNRDVHVYDGDGASLGSWTAGGLNRPDGIATDETDIWVLDGKNKQVYRYSGAAGTTSGSQAAASSFALDGANRKAKGITTDGTSIWVVNDGKTADKVFKYDTSGTLLGSWSIDGANAKPSGITIDPSGSSQSIWIVDRGAAMVFEYAAARGASGGSLSGSFGLASGNTRPEGIADPFVNAAAAATDQVLSQAAADPLAALYWADFAASHDSHSKPKKDKATDLALMMME